MVTPDDVPAPAPLLAQLCQYCGMPVLQRDVVCAECATPHHRECFLEAGRCTTYACGSRAFVDGPTGLRHEIEAAPSVARTDCVSPAALALRGALARLGTIELRPRSTPSQASLNHALAGGLLCSFSCAVAYASLRSTHAHAGALLVFPFFAGVAAAVYGLVPPGQPPAVVVDRKAGEIRFPAGTAGRSEPSTLRLADLRGVAVTIEPYPDGHRYALSLHFTGRRIEVFDALEDRFEARAVAEELAHAFGVSMGEFLDATPAIRSPERLDETVRERVRRTGRRPTLPKPPADGRLVARRTEDGLGLEIELPGPGGTADQELLAALMLPFGLPLLLAAGWWLPSTLQGFTWQPASLAAYLVAFLGFAAGLTLLSHDHRLRIHGSTVLRVSPAALKVGRPGLTRAPITLPGAELEELELIPTRDRSAARCVVARSDRAEVAFGHGLRDDELRWLHATLVHELTRDDGPGKEAGRG